ncbi:MAG TPA: hypothetical protein VF867_03220 [Arthrobacter sp.]
MTTEPNRKPEGIPTGGQFAAQLKSDDVVALGAPARRPELEGWPASLPDPEVDVQVGEGGTISTTVSVNGEPAFDVWNPADDIHDTESDDFVNDAITDDVHDEARAWAFTKHNEMADALRAEQQESFRRSRAAIMAKATGTPVPQSDEDLEQLISASFITYNAVQRDGELASTALIARGVLKDYPEAAYIGLRVEGADNGDYVSGLVVYSADKVSLGGYEEADLYLDEIEEDAEASKPRGEEFMQHLNNLPANPLNSHWQQYSPRTYDDFDEYAIDLKKAAAWTPGSAA